jgi:hypothetical protein
MILVGSQRSGAGALAKHLLNDRENDHVEVLELRGFVSSDLKSALQEAEAVSRGTQCKQFMFSLSLNPPKDADASIEAMLAAADKAEAQIGLSGQPRAIVCHEKEGRRHIHVVWSRINVAEMKAIEMPFFKNRLMTVGKALYLEHGWDLPDGHKENGWKNPLNFSRADWEQAKRLGLDPRELRQLFRESWEQSDGLKSFKAALEDRGYFLARGDRRGFVALDVHGEVFSVARMVGVKTKDLEARLGSPDGLRSVDETNASIKSRMSERLRTHLKEFRQDQKDALAPVIAERRRIVALQRLERVQLRQGQSKRLADENRERQARIRRGIGGVWDILTGRAAIIRRDNDSEAYAGYLRDRSQREAVFTAQIKERRDIQRRVETMRAEQRRDLMRMVRQVSSVLRPELDINARDATPRRSRGNAMGLEP